MVIARRAAAAAAMAAFALGGATAGVSATQLVSQADTSITQADRKPRPLQPVSPPGLVESGVDRPDEANTPLTGRTNQFK
ncbi:hypothetical protein [Streptomyces sp. NPDC002855]|uniref:hypothetical protein n=1 Tax=unclassified Streptomyces TaxID=2593676 RepID=UPI0033233598